MVDRHHLEWRRRRPITDDEAEKDAIHYDADSENEKVSIRERIRHFTWAWFTLPMSTGGLSLLLHSTPHHFPGLETIGKIVFILNLVIFLSLTILISTRFLMNPGSLQKSLMHPTEALFFPTFFLALETILNAIQVYGVGSLGEGDGKWLVMVMEVSFWVYVPVTFGVAVLQYLFLFEGSPKRLTIQSMLPGWILPVFPVMLTGTFASIIAPTQPISSRGPILTAGLTFQGLGFLVSMMVYPMYFHRLFQYGLPAPNLRPGMFIAVGPPSFTGLALIGMSQALDTSMSYFAHRPGVIEFLQTIALMAAIFLWCLSFWFFCVSTLAVSGGVRKMEFHLTWWAFVFPNVGWTIATGYIGEQLESEGILWVASAMAILLVVMWLFVFTFHVKAVATRQIMMPGKDEDKDQYKEGDRKAGIPVPPSVAPTPIRGRSVAPNP